MKIAFITSCLEPSRDGVGDYTRSLAEECVRQGCECCLLSVNDSFLTQISQSEIATDEVKIPVLRLPPNITWSQRTAQAENLLAAWQPDWISLQFVPYGFQAKGIVFDLSRRLSPLIQGRQMHIMFHELWIGEYIGAKLKERLVGTVQKFFIRQLIKQLQPLVIHTSNSTYVTMLRQLGVSASRLSMFGSIPISKRNGDDWLFPKLQNLGLDIKLENRDQFWLFGFFGTLHSIWPAEPLFTYLHKAGIQQQRKIAIVSIGRLGTGEKLWESLSKNYSQFFFLRLGEQSPNKVSEFFNSINFGISTSPYLLVGKSSSTASMLEHGLPVIVNRDDFQLLSSITPQEKESLLYKMDCQLVDKIGSNLVRQVPRSRLENTATQFIRDLIA